MKNSSLVEEVPGFEQSAFPGPVLLGDDLKNRISADLKHFIDLFMTGLNIDSRGLTIGDIEDFFTSYPRNPAREGTGSTRYNSLLWLFLFCRVLKPAVIVESGVYIGRSLWTLRKASPDAQLHAFDINLKPLKFHKENIKLKEMDWSQSDVTAKSGNDLCYFDDHINNCLRIKQAKEKGFKHLIFDDSPSIMNLSHFRFPGVPTAQMLLSDNLSEGDVISWKWRDKVLRYVHSESNTYGVREIIEKIVVLPGLETYTGREGSAHFVYVQLK